MIKDYMRFLANYMESEKGLYGIVSRAEFGKTTFMLRLLEMFLEKDKKCLFFSPDLPEEYALNRMEQLKINTNRLTVVDYMHRESSMFLNITTDIIQKEKPQCVFIDELSLVDSNICEVLKVLKDITVQFSIPIIFTLSINRRVGWYDHFDYRPELYDLMYRFPRKTPVGDAIIAINCINCIMFLHRHSDCIAYPDWYVSDRIQLIIKGLGSSLPDSYSFSFSDLV